jgi:hypothetical protein
MSQGKSTDANELAALKRQLPARVLSPQPRPRADPHISAEPRARSSAQVYSLEAGPEDLD